jgi:hypothetical protein
MAGNAQKLAKLLGAKVVGEVPDAGGGAFGAARLARCVAELRARLAPSRGRRPGRPTDASWARRAKVPMSEITARKLADLAQKASTPERQVSPMQVAAQLLEQAVAQLPDG